MKKFLFLMFIMLLLFGVNAFAGTTGAIQGKVTDAETEAPLANVKVSVVGTGKSAVTDANGYYVIINLHVGAYDIKAELVNYNPMTITDVPIMLDVTTTEDFKLEQTDNLMDVIVVISERSLINRQQGVSEHRVDAFEIKDIPMGSFQSIATTLPGVVSLGGQLHIRGGREDEILYMVDGMSIQDPVTGTFGGNINNNAIESISIQTGGFTAEYGEALSGVINVVTKEGGLEYSSELTVLTSDLVPKQMAHSEHEIAFEIGGPIPIGITPKEGMDYPLLSFFFSGERSYSNRDWLDNYDYNRSNEFSMDWPWSDFIDTSTKISLKIDQFHKLKIGYQKSWAAINVMVPDTWATQRDEHLPTQFQDNQQWNLEWDHTLTNSLFYQLRLYQYSMSLAYKVDHKSPEDYVWEPDYEDPENDHRDCLFYEDRHTIVKSIKFDLINHANEVHEIKTGLRYSNYILDEDLRNYPSFENSYQREYHGRKVDGQSFYLLDNMDWWEDLIINFGLRYDRREYSGSQVCPRLFLSFAITDYTKFRFNYGIYFQPPALGEVIMPQQQEFGISGNQFLEAARSTNYEFGIEHMFSDNLVLNVTSYYKSASGLVQFVTGDFAGNPMGIDMPMNIDHSFAQGLELKLTKAFANNFYYQLSYTNSVAKGTNSSSWTFISSRPTKEYFLDWDVRHNIAFNLMYQDEGGGINVLYQYLSGMPYTPLKQENNSGRQPDWKRCNLSLWKNLNTNLLGAKYALYAQIDNVFNTRNFDGIDAVGEWTQLGTPIRGRAGIRINW